MDGRTSRAALRISHAGDSAGVLPDVESAAAAQQPLLVPKAPPRRVGADGRALSSKALVAGCCWIACSAANILLNKRVLSHYSFGAVHALLAYHCAIAAALLKAAQAAGRVELAPLTYDLFVIWAPLNLIFVGMLATAFQALRLVRSLAACQLCVRACVFRRGGVVLLLLRL